MHRGVSPEKELRRSVNNSGQLQCSVFLCLFLCRLSWPHQLFQANVQPQASQKSAEATMKLHIYREILGDCTSLENLEK